MLSDLFRYTARYRGYEERAGGDRRPEESLCRDIHYLHPSHKFFSSIMGLSIDSVVAIQS